MPTISRNRLKAVVTELGLAAFAFSAALGIFYLLTAVGILPRSSRVPVLSLLYGPLTFLLGAGLYAVLARANDPVPPLRSPVALGPALGVTVLGAAVALAGLGGESRRL